jgi:hypothetical protein
MQPTKHAATSLGRVPKNASHATKRVAQHVSVPDVLLYSALASWALPSHAVNWMQATKHALYEPYDSLTCICTQMVCIHMLHIHGYIFRLQLNLTRFALALDLPSEILNYTFMLNWKYI